MNNTDRPGWAIVVMTNKDTYYIDADEAVELLGATLKPVTTPMFSFIEARTRRRISINVNYVSSVVRDDS